MRDRQFSPGFRLSTIDFLVLLVATAVSVEMGIMHDWIGGVIAFVVCHFFLFCNIFRISRPLELVWAGVFLVLAVCSVLFARPGWIATYGLSLVITVIVVAIEMRKPSYHGIWWQRINPGLREWWETNAGA